MSDTSALVAEAVAATAIHPPARYSWFGHLSPKLPPRIARAMSRPAVQDYLVLLLAGQLYRDFYRRGRAEPPRWSMRASGADKRQFQSALSAANCGQGHLDPGWQVLRRDGLGMVVERNGLELTVDATEVTGPAGGPVALRLPKESAVLSPGFHLVYGDNPLRLGADRRMVRLYWHLRADGAVAFVAAATRLLNSAGAAFRLKVLNDPGAFGRCDAGVIYLAGADYPDLAGLILRLHAEIAGFLSPRTPVFTAELAPGLGFAEDPGTAESFGEHRCRLLAEALVGPARARGTADALTPVRERFARAGIDLDAAHLSPLSAGPSGGTR